MYYAFGLALLMVGHSEITTGRHEKREGKTSTKGQLRLGWRVCESSFVNCLAEHIEDTVIPDILAAVDDFEAEDIEGMSLLTPSDRAR